MPLDIRRLQRAGCLTPGNVFSWHWTNSITGERVGSITIWIAVQSMDLSYSWTPNSDEPRSMRYGVRIERTPCRFGGSRPWFRCVRCNRRCAVLYGRSRDGYFGCRVCLKLGYLSESEDAMGRLWRKQRKLEARVGKNGERPKWMRKRTYQDIRERIIDVAVVRDEAFMIAAALLRRLSRHG
jgi:hypothetical protein